jgi:lipoprotein-anchoring transpeptidase ErfK/SrfK
MQRVLMLLVLAFLLVACSGSSPGSFSGGVAPHPQAQVSTLPGNKASNVSPTLPVSVRVIGGVLNQIALTNADGRAVAGTLSADRHSWISSEALGYAKTYTWSGSAAGPDRVSVPVAGTFTTVTPQRQLRATLNIGDGDTVGIAAPIILQFDRHVSDKAAAERALQVQASVPTEGSWAWLPDDNGGSRAHYRPKDYWEPGTKVNVTAKLYGVALGNGSYGKEDWAVRISNNGEFIHANPETTGVQGSSNVTHGCVNLSTANAQEYFGTAIFGDPVEVTNSPTPLTGADGDIYDWTVPWDSWLAMSALHS